MAIEVTVDNFDTLLPSIIADLSECDFICKLTIAFYCRQCESNLVSPSPVAFDCEFTGLVADERLQPSLFDDIPRRYSKCRLSASKFQLCQIGLTAYNKIPSLYKNQFSSVSYCFYLCKRSYSQMGPVSFLLDASSVEFLADNSFDFNKWIKLGIPYVNESEARYLKQALSSEALLAKWIPDIEDEDDFYKIQLGIESVMAGISDKNFIKISDTQYKTLYNRSVNQFRDLMLLRLLKTKFAHASFEIEGDYLFINLQDDSPDLISTLNEKILNYMKGFTRLFESIVKMKKIVVGHNCFMDLLFIYNSLIDPLPKSHQQFKRTISKIFPVIYDTKTILYRVKKDYPDIRALIGNGKSLNDFYQSLTSAQYRDNFFHDPIISSKNGKVVERIHNASFDSYCTGCVFIKLVHSIICHKLQSSAYPPPTWQMYIESIGPVVNHVNIIRASVNCLVSNRSCL